MKIIHTADLHLGSKMDTRFDKATSDERKRELRNTFRRMVAYAAEQGVSVILLCGDIFDSDRPFKKDKDFFFRVVQDTPGIDFLYLRGNHDTEGAMPEGLPANLKLFSDTWTYYTYGDVTVAGVEIDEKNRGSYEAGLILDKGGLNIAMLHGQVGDGADIRIKRLRDKNIDYLALGHVHKYMEGRIDERGSYVYCGCPEGRGFDEPGEHGFVLLTAEKGTIAHTFVPFAARTIREERVDVSGCRTAYEAAATVKKKVAFAARDLYRIYLTGEVNFDVDDLAEDVRSMLEDCCCFCSVKDKTERTIDVEKFRGDLSVRGEFVRTVLAQADMSEEEQMAAICCGLRALDGKEIEL